MDKERKQTYSGLAYARIDEQGRFVGAHSTRRQAVYFKWRGEHIVRVRITEIPAKPAKRKARR